MSTAGLLVDGLGVEMEGRRLLAGISLSAAVGTSVAVTGPSGSGKSVLLHTVAGLHGRHAGLVALDGEAVEGTARALGLVGVILQNHGLAAGLTAEENVALPLQSRGLTREDIAARCAESLAAVDLTEVARRTVDDLSGGQRQRVGVARALAGHPALLVADEPTAELDPANRSRVLGLLLSPTPRRIVLIASNDPEIAEACDQVLHLRDGSMVAAPLG